MDKERVLVREPHRLEEPLSAVAPWATLLVGIIVLITTFNVLSFITGMIFTYVVFIFVISALPEKTYWETKEEDNSTYHQEFSKNS